MEDEDFKVGDNEDAVKTVIMYKETYPTTWITVDKAAEVFAEMLALVGHGTEHGLGGAKEWENEFRKRLKE